MLNIMNEKLIGLFIFSILNQALKQNLLPKNMFNIMKKNILNFLFFTFHIRL